MKTRIPSKNSTQITPRQRLEVGTAANPAPGVAPLLALLAVTAVLVSGCTVVSYTNDRGERFSRAALGARTSIASLAVEAGSNGVRRIELRGYQNDAAQALSTVTEAAVRAAMGGRQP